MTQRLEAEGVSVVYAPSSSRWRRTGGRPTGQAQLCEVTFYHESTYEEPRVLRAEIWLPHLATDPPRKTDRAVYNTSEQTAGVLVWHINATPLDQGFRKPVSLSARPGHHVLGYNSDHHRAAGRCI
jgi:hypothetical protein